MINPSTSPHDKTRDILVELSDARRADAAAREAARPYRRLLRDIAQTPEPRDFAAAFRRTKGTPRIIAELKKASPSEGLIRADFRPAALAAELAQAGAAALSRSSCFFAAESISLMRLSWLTSLAPGS